MTAQFPCPAREGETMTATTPSEMRAQASWLDGYADGIEDTFEDGEQADIESHRSASAALRAAADEVDRLRKRVAWFDRYTPLGLSPEWINAIAQDNDELRERLAGAEQFARTVAFDASEHAAEIDRLRALIKNAPHRFNCQKRITGVHLRTQGLADECTCWKADAL